MISNLLFTDFSKKVTKLSAFFVLIPEKITSSTKLKSFQEVIIFTLGASHQLPTVVDVVIPS